MDKYQKMVFGVVIFLAVALTIIFNMDLSGHDIKYYDDKISINVDNVKFSEIENIELLDDVFIGSKIKGSNTFTYSRGTFNLGNNTSGKVYVYNKSKPYIRITTKDKVIIYNDKDSNETKETYNKLLSVSNIKPSIISTNNKINESSEIKYKSNNSSAVYTTVIPLILIYGGMSIYSFKKKTPVHFWAGSVVKSEEITDIKAYNKANGIMWLVFCVLIVSTLFISLPSLAVIFIISEVIGMMICYTYIYKKYKVKR
ncbi:MAG: hypothetical protein ACRC3Y_05960 [Romboutsia sp.]|uniref:hypothetical protein n=1 Tax=Romboutsia sp. TaxID=1965302 RepID=UPI003F33A583